MFSGVVIEVKRKLTDSSLGWGWNKESDILSHSEVDFYALYTNQTPGISFSYEIQFGQGETVTSQANVF